jgi:hypothetical protein
MGVVVTTGATVECGQKGTVAQPAAPVKLKVGGNAVSVSSAVSTWTTAGCQAVLGNTASPCTSVGAPTAGTAGKLKVGGSAVLLKDFSAPANQGTVPDPMVHTVSVTKTASDKLKAV